MKISFDAATPEELKQKVMAFVQMLNWIHEKVENVQKVQNVSSELLSRYEKPLAVENVGLEPAQLPDDRLVENAEKDFPAKKRPGRPPAAKTSDPAPNGVLPTPPEKEIKPAPAPKPPHQATKEAVIDSLQNLREKAKEKSLSKSPDEELADKFALDSIKKVLKKFNCAKVSELKADDYHLAVVEAERAAATL